MDSHPLLNFDIPAFPTQCINLPIIPGLNYLRLDNSSWHEIISPLANFWLFAPVIDGEAGIIGRDDGLLNILHILSGLTLSSRVDFHEMSRINSLRSDRSDLYQGIPLVITEEKSELPMTNCINDLTRKFQWIPHYSQARLPYIFGIAINRNEISLGKLDLSAGYHVFYRSGLNSLTERLNTVGVIIRMACAIKYFIENHIGSVTSRIPINGPWQVANEKSIRICLRYVEHRFPPTQQTLYQFLKQMYTNTQHIPHKEKLVENLDSQFDDTQRIIRLYPVGRVRKPQSIAEMKSCLFSVIECLEQFHLAGYVHCDIRWDNIIFCNNEWSLIDFTLCKQITDIAGLNEIASKIRPGFTFGGQGPWSPAHDFYQVGRLIELSDFSNRKRFRSIKEELLNNPRTLNLNNLKDRISEVNEN